MHVRRFPKGLAALALAAILVPVTIGAQVRDIVSKQVSVGRDEATLRLEFADRGELEISFEDRDVRVDGDIVGRFQAGDDLDAAWRALLGQAVALDNGALATALSDWTIPAGLAGELADVAREIDRILEGAVSTADLTVSSEGGSVSLSFGDEASLLRALVNSTSRIGLLDQALDGLNGDFRIHVEEDIVVPAGSRVDGTLVVVNGNARIGGEVDGDIVVVGGSVELLDGSRIRGDVRLADARVQRNLGEVDGDIVDVLEEERSERRRERDEIRDEVRNEFRSELRNELRNVTRRGFDDDNDGFSLMAPFRPIAQGVGNLIGHLFKILILGLIGAAAVAFAGENVDAIAETARRSPGRSAMVGLAGSLLFIPAWIIGAIALVVSIIGIPVAVAWLPLFPLAALAAATLGYLAVARNAGEWLADTDLPWTDWIRKSNPIHTLTAGLIGLALAVLLADVISIAPFLGILSGLLTVVGGIVTFLAMQIGFGAVLLTRAGRRREYWSTMDPEEAWAAAMDVDVEVDVDPAPAAKQKATTDDSEGGDDDA